MPTEYTDMRSLDGKRINRDDHEECATCGSVWTKDHVCASDPFTSEELMAMNAIEAALIAIEDLGIKYNKEELVAAIHVLQEFPIQHMLHRRWPDQFSDWA